MCVVAGTCVWIFKRGRGVGGEWFAVLALASGSAAIALMITSAGISQKHKDDHCHALGGVIDSGGAHECVKPNSFIHA